MAFKRRHIYQYKWGRCRFYCGGVAGTVRTRRCADDAGDESECAGGLCNFHGLFFTCERRSTSVSPIAFDSKDEHVRVRDAIPLRCSIVSLRSVHCRSNSFVHVPLFDHVVPLWF